MSNYTSKSQKIEMYSKKYNKTEEEINRILTEHEALLTKEELGIKYDTSHIGELPQWLVDEGGYDVIASCIETAINSKFDYRWSTWTSKEELTSYMWEFILKKVHLYQTRGHIVTAVKNRMVWLWRENFGRGIYMGMSLQDYYGRNEEGNRCTYADVMPAINDKEETEMKEWLLAIPDKQTRDLLTVVAYLYSDTDFLLPEFNKIIKTADKETKQNILQVVETIKEREDADRLKIEGKEVKRKPKFTIKDIVKAMNYNIQKLSTYKVNENGKKVYNTQTLSVDQSIKELQEYIVNLGLATYPKKREKREYKKWSIYETYGEKGREEPTQAGEVTVSHINSRPDLQEKYKDIYESYNSKLPMVMTN